MAVEDQAGVGSAGRILCNYMPNWQNCYAFTPQGSSRRNGFYVGGSADPRMRLYNASSVQTVEISAGGADSYWDTGANFGWGTTLPSANYLMTMDSTGYASGAILLNAVPSGHFPIVFTHGSSTSGSGLLVTASDHARLQLRNATDTAKVWLDAGGDCHIHEDAFRVDESSGTVASGGAATSTYAFTGYSAGDGAFYANSIPADDWAYAITYPGSTSASGFQASTAEDLRLRMRDASNVETVRLATNGTCFIDGPDFVVGSTSASDFFHVNAAGDSTAFRIDDTLGNTGLSRGPHSGYKLHVGNGTSGHIFCSAIPDGDFAFAMTYTGSASGSGFIVQGADLRMVLRNKSNTENVRFDSDADSFVLNDFGVGTNTPNSPLHVHQDSTTRAVPVATLEQDDTDEPFIDFVGTEAATTSATISTLTTSGAVQKHIQIDANGTKYWIALLADPS